MELIGERPGCEIKLALALVAAGDAQTLEIAHHRRITLFEGERVYAKRKQQSSQ